MNLLEHYIKEVYSEERVDDYILVHVKVNCYGCIEDKKQYFSVHEWDKAKKRGYYMA